MPDQRKEFSVSRFEREFFTGQERATLIGSGEIGGKAHGLVRMGGVLEEIVKPRFEPSVSVCVPRLTIITTELFDRFMSENDLFDIALSDKRDEVKAHAFQRASLPVTLVGDLRAVAEQVHTPLAVRSSSLLEDAMFEPFASVYATKMVPNNLPAADSRFQKLSEAVKFVYASTFFKSARDYMKVCSHSVEDEKMAVIIQDIVGTKFGDRYYPHVSGVMRSFNFYPFGRAEPEEGVVELALGLGRSIVDDGISWAFSPAWPEVAPPFRSTGELLKYSQTEFWAVNMGKMYDYNPVEETEYLERFNLKDCEYDGAISLITSTYNYQDDRLECGTMFNGPRVLDFSPILRSKDFRFNELLTVIMKKCEEELGAMVEIEFAVRLGETLDDPAEFGFLQARPMIVSKADVTIDEEELFGPRSLISSETVMGNGIDNAITDVVCVDPDTFDIRRSREIAFEIEFLNDRLIEEGRKYVLIGFGRWGTTDPLGGIPVDFGQISGAKVIVETSLPSLNFMPSQGSHFFHNVTSFKVFYFSVRHGDDRSINWKMMEKVKLISRKKYVKHLRFDEPLLVKVDGKSGRGVVLLAGS